MWDPLVMATSELSLIASIIHAPSPDILSPSHIHMFPHSSRTSWNVVGSLGGGGSSVVDIFFCILAPVPVVVLGHPLGSTTVFSSMQTCRFALRKLVPSPKCRFPQVHSLLMAVEQSEGVDIIDPMPYLVPYSLVSAEVESPSECSDLEKCFFP